MKNKGFTLIELLAVIVILAVISLIAVPMILGAIEDSRTKAAIISAENYIYAVEQYLVLQEVENYSVKLQNNTTYKVEEDTVFEFSLMDVLIPKVYALPSEEVFLNDIIKIKGEYPKDGYVEIGDNKIASAELVLNDYIVTCTNSVDCEITGDYSSNIIAVDSIEINEVEKTEIEIGETLQLSATVMPEDATNKKVTWTSNNNEIATVDENGLVTANQQGTVTITATSSKKSDTLDLNISIPKVCKKAKTLHSEICNQNNTYNYCTGAKFKPNSIVVYGTIPSGTSKVGDAYTCDVNGDGKYDETTERFYYITDMNASTAVLIYYNNVSGGKPNNMISYAYNKTDGWNDGPTTAIKQLPTITQWKNVSLTSTIRKITDEDGKVILSNFNYAGYAARLLTYAEVNQACEIFISTRGEIDNCNFLMENTIYTNPNLKTNGGWLETKNNYAYDAWYVDGNPRSIDHVKATTNGYVGVRPAIEVSKSQIES